MPDKPDPAATEARALYLVRGFIDLLLATASDELRNALLKLRP